MTGTTMTKDAVRRNRHPAAKAIQETLDKAIEADRARALRLLNKRLKANPEAPLASKAEQRFREMARKLGWDVHRSGWPDFALTRAQTLELVEVKALKDRLSERQVTLFTALEIHGIAVKVWWEGRPESLFPWRVFARLNDKSGPVKRAPRLT